MAVLREALRRALWLAPTLVAVTLVAFWLLSELLLPRADGTADIPRFFNPAPSGVGERVVDALDAMEGDDAAREQAQATLVRTGAASFPFLLPRLDALNPATRARVALALQPVARRMGIGSPEDFISGEAAMFFWSRYWEDHSVDFRPTIVKRAVRRYAERPSAFRKRTVFEFDTYALAELVARMRTVDDAEDAARVQRLSWLAAHATGQRTMIPATSAIGDARIAADQWGAWWSEHQHEYVAFQGFERVIAMVRETRYGKWAASMALWRASAGSAGEASLSELSRRGLVTLWLLLVAVCIGYPVGLLGGAIAPARGEIHQLWIAAVAIACAGVPSALLAAWGAGRGAGLFGAGTVVAAVTAAFVMLHQRSARLNASEYEHVRTAVAFGIPRWQILVGLIPQTAVILLSMLAVDVSAMLTTIFVVEHAFELDGLGPRTIAAVVQGDIDWLMMVAIVTTLTVGLVQVGCDLSIDLVSPRARRWRVEVGGRGL